MIKLPIFRNTLKVIAVLSATLALAGCFKPQEISTEGMRPGISSGKDYQEAELRPGLRVSYEYVTPPGSPLKMSSSFATRRGDGENIDYSGQLRLFVPGGDAERIAEIMLPPGIDLPFRVSGDSVIFDGEGTVDRMGRHLALTTRLESAVFSPHDCMAVLGTCRSTAVRSDGERVHVIVETTEANGFWRSTTRLDPMQMQGSNRLIARNVFSLDRTMLLIDMRTIDYQTQPIEPVMIRRIK